MDAVWTHTSQDVLAHFTVDPEQGLTSSQAEKHAEIYGKNELPEDPPTSLLELILEQFKDQLVLILLGSAVVSFVLALVELREPGNDSSLFTAFVEPSVIVLILIANAAVGVIQETSAEKAIDALKEYSPDIATVLRDGHLQKIVASNLVPGDIVSVSVGDQIPADCRLLSISSSSFRIDQAILTGESIGVHKSIAPVLDAQAVKQDQTNLLFSGTTVVNGTARAVVVAIGSKTAIGDIHSSISMASQITEKTPLKKKLDDFGDMLAKVISVICLLVWLVNIRHFSDPSHGGSIVKGGLYYLKIAVALAVAAIPEGLAAVITACLALGTKKMAKHGAIVRSLPSVETLGCTQVVCSDKTGTLTTNQMSVSRFLVIEGSGSSPQPTDYYVEGTTFSPIGKISVGSASGPVVDPSQEHPVLTRLAEISSLCNDASIQYQQDKNAYSALGEPTEAALKVLVEKIGTSDSFVATSLPTLAPLKRTSALSDYHTSQLERLLTFEFSRDRKMMSVLVARKETKEGHLFVKGAPEAVLEQCSYVMIGSGSSATRVPLTPELRASLLRTATQTYGTSAGLRTLALAYTDVSSTDPSKYLSESSADYARFEKELTFVSLVGMLDPPRPEVRKAVENLRDAGIRVVVITGDNKGTAESVCRQIGIFDDVPDEDEVEATVTTGLANGNGHAAEKGDFKKWWSFTGREFDELDREGKIMAVKHGRLFSRTEPGHKSQLVDLMQELGMVVAMTGDGVNDAPALKKADIGIAMGSGTDVAKHAADMVLADSNFATIEVAVEEGRLIYANTKQFIRYLISSNIGEVVSIFLTVLLGMPEALIPVQLLWVNLVTDSLPATALGFNPADHSLMKEAPRDSREPLVGKWLFFRYMLVGTYVGVATVAGYAWWFMSYAGGPQISFYELTHFHQCSTLFPGIGCEMFTNELAKRATTISLSILVTVEMFNAMNSLSENESLLRLPLWKNMYLVGAITLSMALHFMILYVPFLAELFVIAPLNWDEWMGVLALSFPVIIIDEVLKFISANFIAPRRKTKTA